MTLSKLQFQLVVTLLWALVGGLAAAILAALAGVAEARILGAFVMGGNAVILGGIVWVLLTPERTKQPDTMPFELSPGEAVAKLDVGEVSDEMPVAPSPDIPSVIIAPPQGVTPPDRFRKTETMLPEAAAREWLDDFLVRQQQP